MSASAGRVLLIFKGDYESATTYKPLDVVIYGVNSYVCLLQSTGNVPTNTTYWQILAKGISNMSPEAIGIGYGLSQNSGASKTATLADYTLTINGIVAVTFAEDVPANATLNINSQGAKPIYYRGSALVANVIRGGDTVTFAYDGTHYDILCIDGGAGHEIENSAGTKLSQRDVLQFNNGLEATDDSTNQKTKVGLKTDYISLADWNAMTEQEQETYKASHYRFGIELPDTSGVINAEYMTLLWENPNTSASFVAQTVTLNSADYDFLFAVVAYSGNYYMVFMTQKGKNMQFSIAATTSGSAVTVFYRVGTYVSDTSYSFNDCTTQNSGATRTVNNALMVPVAIYGIKKNFQFKVNAIASELSTRADHCFLDDEVTTVEDALTDFIKVETLSKQVNITANAQTSVTFDVPQISGYKAVGVVSFNTNITNANVYTNSISINDAGTSVNYRFVTNGAYTGQTISVKVMYVKTIA